MLGGLHLDPNVIAAFRENTLTAEEREAAFAHLAVCGMCRHWLALSVEASVSSREQMIHAERLPRWAKAAAAVLCVIVGSLLLSRHAPPAQSRAANPIISLRAAPANTPGHLVEIASERLDVHASRRRSPALRRALFHPIRFNAGADFGNPQAPGPWGRAKLGPRVRFEGAFRAQTLSQDASASVPALNQISIRTNMGERWITLTAFEATMWQSFR